MGMSLTISDFVSGYFLRETRVNVKRVVVTSSCGAVMAPPSKPTVFSEKDWNLESLADVEVNGKQANNMSKYRSSKVMAEKGSS